MLIQQSTYEALLKEIPCAPPETGGILGGTNEIITMYQVDFASLHNRNYDYYYPNLTFLNHTIQKWSDAGIEFYGLFHSHFPGGTELSLQDKRYISKIMYAMPQVIDRLFFPIILTGEIVSYQAFKCDKNVCIVRDDIIKIS